MGERLLGVSDIVQVDKLEKADLDGKSVRGRDVDRWAWIFLIESSFTATASNTVLLIQEG